MDAGFNDNSATIQLTRMAGWLSELSLALLIACLVFAAFLMCRSVMKSIRFAQLLEGKGKENREATEFGRQMDVSQRGGRMPVFARGMGPTITLEERLRSIMNEKATGRMSDRHRSFLSIFGLAVLLIHPLATATPSSGGVVIAFSQDVEIPSLQPIPEETLTLPSLSS